MVTTIVKKTVLLKPETKKRLLNIGKMNQSFDELINEILDHVELCDRFWGNRN